MKKKSVIVMGITACVFGGMLSNPAEAATKKTYSITPKTEAIDPLIRKYTTYNAKTRNHYTMRSYLEKLEAEGGGTLILKKGTYLSPLRVGIPSNTTVILEDGVIIKKTSETGTSKISATSSVFDLVAPSVLRLNKKMSGYNGTKNAKIIGKGNAQIDLNHFPRGSAFAIAHNENLYIGGITVRNQKGSHAMELDATNKAVIENMKFVDSTMIPNTGPNESINLDTPDPVTKGFPWKWSKQDSTPNQNITIRKNKFLNINVAIGTHQYSENRLHSNVRIENNLIDGTKDYAISMMNWKNPTVINNVIRDVHRADKKAMTILGRGVIGGTIRYNQFENADRAIQMQPFQSDGYAPIYNAFTENQKKIMQQNRIKNVGLDQIVLFTKLNEFTYKTAERYPFMSY
ncbi:hypothetical protein [Exiguobacterium undae]